VNNWEVGYGSYNNERKYHDGVRDSRCRRDSHCIIENNQALKWLAEFLTGDEMIASACVIDACNLTERAYEIGQERFWTCPCNANIHSALDIERSRIAQLFPVYDSGFCIHEHAPASQDMIGFAASDSDAIRHNLDVLCRFVLILCGVEQRPPCEAALLLRISKHAVDVACCATLDFAGGYSVPGDS
jgi:hypothetical protein